MMKGINILAIVGIVMMIAVLTLMRSQSMTENEKCLKEARDKIKAFESEREPERLRESAMALENIILAKEFDAKIRKKLRADSLSLWLTLIQILDKNLQPDFNPENTPDLIAQPSPLPDGTVLRPGTDPAKINDPKVKADYEKAIAENREKQENYRMQTQLRRLNEQIPPKAETFIRNFYTSDEADREELKNAIDGIIQKPERKEELLNLLKSQE